MSDDVREDEAREAAGEGSSSPARSGRTGRVVRRVALVLLGTAAGLAVLGVVLYQFGSMETPPAEMRARYAQLQASGQARPIEQRFHIPIPGCRCHSSDPVLTMQHSTIRIRECSSCHSRSGGPEVSAR